MLFLLDPPGEGGVKPSYWGGFVLNLIFAFGSLVIGFVESLHPKMKIK